MTDSIDGSAAEAVARAKAKQQGDAEVLAMVAGVVQEMKVERVTNGWGGRISAAVRRVNPA